MTPAAAGERLLFIGGAYDRSGIGTVSVSTAPTGFTTDVNVSSNDFLGYVALANDPRRGLGFRQEERDPDHEHRPQACLAHRAEAVMRRD